MNENPTFNVIFCQPWIRKGSSKLLTCKQGKWAMANIIGKFWFFQEKEGLGTRKKCLAGTKDGFLTFHNFQLKANMLYVKRPQIMTQS